MSEVTAKTRRVWTESELQAMPDEGYIHEVVEGELVMSPKNNFQHEQICERLNFDLESFNRLHRLGAVFGSNMGFWMQSRNCRAPDVSFVPKARLLQLGFKPDTKTFFPGAPDLAAEVLSPANSRVEIDQRLGDFFSSGARLVWIIHPDQQFVEVCHSLTDRRIVGPAGSLEGDDLLPGFHLTTVRTLKGPSPVASNVDAGAVDVEGCERFENFAAFSTSIFPANLFGCTPENLFSRNSPT